MLSERYVLGALRKAILIPSLPESKVFARGKMVAAGGGSWFLESSPRVRRELNMPLYLHISPLKVRLTIVLFGLYLLTVCRLDEYCPRRWATPGC